MLATSIRSGWVRTSVWFFCNQSRLQSHWKGLPPMKNSGSGRSTGTADMRRAFGSSVVMRLPKRSTRLMFGFLKNEYAWTCWIYNYIVCIFPSNLSVCHNQFELTFDIRLSFSDNTSTLSGITFPVTSVKRFELTSSVLNVR